MKSRRVYIDIDESTEVVIKLMLGKNYLSARDYQQFFMGLIINATTDNKRLRDAFRS